MIGPSEIATYVVNLSRRTDRRDWMQTQLPASLPVTYTSDMDATFDGRYLTLATLRAAGVKLFDWQINSDNPWWNRPLKYGEIGCTLAHLSCWKHAVGQSESPYIMILEDDAVLGADFLTRLVDGLNRLEQQSISFDLLYLGRYPLEPDRPSPLPQFVYPGYSHCSYAYLVTRSALVSLLATGLAEAVVPIDEFLPAMYQPHARPDIQARFPPQLTALAFDPPLASQRPKLEAGSDTEDSDFVEP
ncbi:glycosyltransferase family 25 protein [Nocardia nova]|uniref:glycosyltransferase family 25 protein n=1 Tax=Nocardia nova TaxID=37330 RepID=UPI0018949360|nr:glycosyltransferase family 25 protein [Nocardia nova]MBF6150234.1 glycosyltransferase family 25 protein [Nocardia nova]